MLSQMPTSALSFLSSSSKGLDGFFGLISVGIQLALTVVLAEFNTEFTTAVRATATVKLVLQPTKCVISNGTGFHPYVATMGSATIVLLVVFYMLLRAKGRDIGDGDPASPLSADIEDPSADSGGQPPSPPEDPETESSPKKRRNRWALFLLVILIWTVLLSLGAALFIAYLVPTLRFPNPLEVLATQTGRIIERCHASISALVTHISLHGQRYQKALLLALVGHLACIIFISPLRRIRRYMFSLGPDFWAAPTGGLFGPWSVMAAIPQLRWILWALWHLLCLPTVNQISQNIRRILCHFTCLAAVQTIDIAILLGPAMIHTAILCLASLLLAVYRIPKAIIRCLCLRSERLYYTDCILGSTIIYTIGYICLLAQVWYSRLPPALKRLVWRSLFSVAARSQIIRVFGHSVQEHRGWKAAQKEAFATIIFELRRAFKTQIRRALEVWCLLSSSQRFLILAPAVILYIYCDLIPTVRRIRRTYWRHRRREI
ncbi:hypothetical protein C8R46DRAFT_1081180 [Mycena filopes]|nr:hypothetical protein C8R46DRAFT_1081180 [Mycena filopes]